MLASASAAATSATSATHNYRDTFMPLQLAAGGTPPRRRRTWHPKYTRSRHSHLSHDFGSDSDNDNDNDDDMVVDSPVPSPTEHFDRFDADFSYDSNTRPAPDTPSAKHAQANGNAPLSALRRSMYDSLVINSPARSPSVRKGSSYGGGTVGTGRRSTSSLETMRPLVFKKQQSLPTILPSSSKFLNLIVFQDDLDKENTCPSAPPPSPRHPCTHHTTRAPLSNISSYYPSAAGISHTQLAALLACTLAAPPGAAAHHVRRSAKSTTQLRNEYMHAVPSTAPRAASPVLCRADTFPLTALAGGGGGGSRRSLPAYIPSRSAGHVLDVDHYSAPVPLTAAEDPLQRADFEVDVSDLALLPVQTRVMVEEQERRAREEGQMQMQMDEQEVQQRQKELR